MIFRIRLDYFVLSENPNQVKSMMKDELLNECL